MEIQTESAPVQLLVSLGTTQITKFVWETYLSPSLENGEEEKLITVERKCCLPTCASVYAMSSDTGQNVVTLSDGLCNQVPISAGL